MFVWKNIVVASVLEKSALNLRNTIAWGVEICPKSGRRFSDVGIICPESGARLCPGGRSLPWIWGKFFRCRNCLPWIWGIFMPRGWKSAPNPGEDFPRSELFALNLGHVYAQGVEVCPESEGRFSDVGIVCPESEARFSEFGMISSRSGAYKWTFKMVCPEKR